MLKSKCVLNKQLDKGLDEMTNVAHSYRKVIFKFKKRTDHNGCTSQYAH